MKKLVMTVAVLACAASIASAQTVTSANMVGYTKVNAVGSELALVALNFETDGATLSELIPGSDLPGLSTIYIWDKGTAAYLVATLSTRGAWSMDPVIDLGDAFWIAPAGTGTNELIFSGEVLIEDSIITLPAGIIATGYGYPVDKDFTTTEMAAELPGLSTVYTWDEGTQAYSVFTKSTRGAWSGSPILDPVGGFWIDNPEGELTVTNTVPFTP